MLKTDMHLALQVPGDEAVLELATRDMDRTKDSFLHAAVSRVGCWRECACIEPGPQQRLLMLTGGQVQQLGPKPPGCCV